MAVVKQISERDIFIYNDCMWLAANGELNIVSPRNKVACHEISVNKEETHSDRPWGCWDSLFKNVQSTNKYQIKHLTVNPGAKISLQKHNHRSEHWIILMGAAKVTCDDKVFTLLAGQSTFIPMGALHRLENVGKIPLEIIECQQGLYIEEDDIIRYDDDFGRCELN